MLFRSTNIETVRVDLVANTETIHPINYTAERDTIYVTLDNSAISVSGGTFSQDTTTCLTCGGGVSRGRELEVLGWNGAGATSTLYGITARAILICDDADIFCDLINKMDVIVLYRSGIEIYKELLLSDRLTPITLFNREAVEKELTALEKDYDKTFKSFKSSIINYLNNKKDVCIQCNTDKVVSRHP